MRAKLFSIFFLLLISAMGSIPGEAGIITTVAGGGPYSGWGWEQHTPSLLLGDGGPATDASFNSPWGLTVDDQGNLYISDTNYRVRRVDSGTGIITTIAGNG